MGLYPPSSGEGPLSSYASSVAEHFDCTEEGCRSTFKANAWTATRRSLERHLERDHGIKIRATANICRKCNADIGNKPTLHSCRNLTPVGARQPTPTRFAYRCADCDESFPTNRGLRNHQQWHRDRVARARNDVPLPQPMTRRGRTRADDRAVPAPADVDGIGAAAVQNLVPATAEQSNEPATPVRDR